MFSTFQAFFFSYTTYVSWRFISFIVILVGVVCQLCIFIVSPFMLRSSRALCARQRTRCPDNSLDAGTFVAWLLREVLTCGESFEERQYCHYCGSCLEETAQYTLEDCRARAEQRSALVATVSRARPIPIDYSYFFIR